MGALKRIFGLVKKEFRLLKADKWALIMALLLPPVVMLFVGVLQGIAIPPPVRIAIVIKDSQTFGVNSSLISWEDNYTTAFIQSVRNFSTISLKDAQGTDLIFNVTSNPHAMHYAFQLLLLHQIDVIIEIPPEFSEAIIFNLSLPMIWVAPDASDVAKVQQFIYVFNDIGEHFIKENNLGQQILYDMEEQYLPPSLFNTDLTYLAAMGFSFIIMGFTMILTILVIVSEAPIPRLVITPAKKEEVLLSKYITYTLVSLAQATVIMISSLVMGAYCPIHLIFDLFLGLFITGFYGITLGMLISTISTSRMQANQLFFFIFIAIMLLGGMFIPIASLLPPLMVIAYCLPMAYASPIFNNIIFRGQSIFATWIHPALPIPNFLILLIISFVFIGITLIWFRYVKKMEV